MTDPEYSAAGSTGEIDPVSVDIFAKSLENIANEMGVVMMRASGSPVIAEAKDFAVCIADALGGVIGYGGYITAYFGNASQSIRHVLQTTPRERIRPGDMFLCNDPFSCGNAHTVDVGVVRPLFFSEELIGWCYANAHLPDFGGVAPGGFAPMVTDCYGEGLRLPGVKVVDQGELIDDIWRLIETNIRVPHLVLNDIRCFMAACNRADERLQELLAGYGPETFRRYIGVAADLAEGATRRRIATLPEGTWEAEDYVEHNGHENGLYRLHCRLTVTGGELIFDLTRSCDQVDGFINCNSSITYGHVAAVSLISLFADLPINEGTLRPIVVKTRPGSICDMQMPAPCSCGHISTGARLSKLITKLLAQAQVASADEFVASHVTAPWQDSWNGTVFYAPDEDGQLIPFLDMNGGGSGGGAQLTADGMNAAGSLVQAANSIPDIEINELTYPVLYLWRSLSRDSGGAGRRRGGLGIELAWTPWYSAGGEAGVFAACSQVPPDGMLGGYPGSASGFSLVTDANVAGLLASGVIPSSLRDFGSTPVELEGKQFGMSLAPGDVLYMRCGGGAGLGDPLERDPAEVAEDIVAGVVSAEAAELGYGVILRVGHTVDEEATQRRREQLRQARLTWSNAASEDSSVTARNLLLRRTPAAEGLRRSGQWCSARDGVQLAEYADATTGNLVEARIDVSGTDIIVSK